MTATERFRLKLFSPMHLSIVWDSKRHGYVPGDCQVVAFSAGAEAETPTLAPMTIDEIRAYVADRTDMLGTLIHDCTGISVQDQDGRGVDFPSPIQVRNRPLDVRI